MIRQRGRPSNVEAANPVLPTSSLNERLAEKCSESAESTAPKSAASPSEVRIVKKVGTLPLAGPAAYTCPATRPLARQVSAPSALSRAQLSRGQGCRLAWDTPLLCTRLDWLSDLGAVLHVLYSTGMLMRWWVGIVRGCVVDALVVRVFASGDRAVCLSA